MVLKYVEASAKLKTSVTLLVILEIGIQIAVHEIRPP